MAPSIPLPLRALAILLKQKGDFAGARQLQERVLAIFGKALGPEHPNTNLARHNLADLLLATGAQTEALALGEKALANHDKALGQGHSWTKGSTRVGLLGWWRRRQKIA